MDSTPASWRSSFMSHSVGTGSAVPCCRQRNPGRSAEELLSWLSTVDSSGPALMPSTKRPATPQRGFASSSPFPRFEADDWPLRFATRHLLETSLVVHGLCPEPHQVVVGTSRFVDGV